MGRTIKIVSLLVIGAVVGVGGTETFHIIRDRHRRDFFEQRIRCKQLAEDYVKKNSDDYTTVFLDRTDFSVRRNSCVAATSTARRGLWNYDVIDVATGDNLYGDYCQDDHPTSKTWCGNGRNISLGDKRDKAFDEAVK